MEGYGNLWEKNKVSLISSRLNEDTERNYYTSYMRKKINENNFLLMIGGSCDIMHVEDTLESSMHKELCHIGQELRCDLMQSAHTKLSYLRRTLAFDPVIKLPSNRISSRRLMHKWIPR